MSAVIYTQQTTPAQRQPQMKRVLLVDDDPVVLRVYHDGLSSLGLEVETAQDGLAALQSLQRAKPDLMVLDLVMPKLSGVDVLKFVRGNSRLADLPVIVLSNSYAEEVAREAAAVGAQKGLLKITCDPLLLAGVIGELLDGQATTETESHLLGVFVPAPVAQVEAAPPGPVNSPPAATTPPVTPVLQTPVSAAGEVRLADPELKAKAHADFLLKAADMSAVLRAQVHAFRAAATEPDRGARLQDLRRRFEFLTATAETAGCVRIARMANALDALLLGMMDKASRITPPALDTTATAVDFLITLFQDRRDTPEPPLAPAEVLVVDDDQLSNRLVVSSLRAVQVKAQSANHPVAALNLLAATHYDLVLLDVEMPGMDGITFCRRLRMSPGYQNTPVIFVTLHSDAQTRARTVESGGNDLITKPISPSELAVKVVMHWLKHLDQSDHTVR